MHRTRLKLYPSALFFLCSCACKISFKVVSMQPHDSRVRIVIARIQQTQDPLRPSRARVIKITLFFPGKRSSFGGVVIVAQLAGAGSGGQREWSCCCCVRRNLPRLFGPICRGSNTTGHGRGRGDWTSDTRSGHKFARYLLSCRHCRAHTIALPVAVPANCNLPELPTFQVPDFPPESRLSLRPSEFTVCDRKL